MEPPPNRLSAPASFFAYRFFSACLPYLPVASACFLARGLTLGDVITLSTVYCLGVALLGIPLGALADRHGHRGAILAGTATLALGGALAALAHGFSAFLVAQLAFAVAGALDAGTDSAFLYQHVSARGADASACRRAEARSQAVKLLGNVVGFAAGGLLAAWSPSAPFAVAAVFAVTAAVFALRLPESSPQRASLSGAAHYLSSARELVHPALGRTVILAALTVAMSRVALTTTSPYLVTLHVPLIAIGLLTAVGALLAAMVAQRAAGLADRFGEQTLLSALPIVVMATVLAMGLARGSVALLFALIPQVLAGLHAPVWRAHLNRQIRDTSRRATVLAMDATFSRLCYAAFTLILGILAAGGGPRAALRGSALLGALALLLVAVLPTRRRRSLGALRSAWAVAAAFALTVIANARGGIAHADDPKLAARPSPSQPAKPIATPADASAAPRGPWSAADDDAVLAKLCSQPIAQLKVNKRGTTIKLKVTFDDGSKASARPAQLLEQGNYHADIAAYRLSRAWNLGMVPPTCPRALTHAALEAAAQDTPVAARLATEVRWTQDGTSVAGAMQLWVDGVVSGRMDTDRSWQPLLLQAAPLPADAGARAIAAEGSRLMTFDFLIANWDRWSGDNTFRIGKTGPFVWLDNAAGFGGYSKASQARNEATFAKVQRFSKSFIAAVRSLDDATLTRELAPAGLTKRQLGSLFARRQRLLQIVDALIAQHGADAVLAFE